MLAGCLGPLGAASCSDDSTSAPPLGDDSTGGKDATTHDSSQSGHDASGHDASGDDVAIDTGNAADGADGATPDVGFDVQEASFNCTVSYDGGSPACNTCMHDGCCGMLQNCDSDPGCSASLQCFEACDADGGSFNACYAGCVGSGADSILFIELSECAQTQCGGSCGFGDGGPVTVGDAG